MTVVLNGLALVLLVLLVLLRRTFTSVIDRPAGQGDPRRAGLLGLLALAYGAGAVFVGVGLWMLAAHGYIPVALFLAVFITLSYRALRVRLTRERHDTNPPSP